ncbi:MAG TPA: F0F1 ATP synthase subunit A [Acidimicrobiales bacterium]|nr:F0F1 ATP synthase subunit A [Acidimicrobiales bacterium]
MIHLLADANIQINNHLVRNVGGLSVQVDVFYSTVVAAVIVITLGLLTARKATSGVPGKLQLFFETVVDQVSQLVESTVGPAGTKIVPLALAIFLFILTANWLAVIPTNLSGKRELLPPPTASVNLTFAMAIVVVVIIHRDAIKTKGWRAYGRHYLEPFAVFLPINIIEEITKPITLALRLFGNLFAGTLMLLLIAALLPIEAVPVVDVVWKLFDMFIGFIQAFIFALLTIVYYGMAVSTEGGH